MRRRDFMILTAAAPWLAAQNDPLSSAKLIDPDAFARELVSQPSGLSIFCVGFPVLYRAAHITGAILAGPCSKPQGLSDLHKALANLPRTREVVLYCGCCPFDKCPNVRPAFSAAKGMGFTNLKVLRLPNSLHANWVVKGYPVQRDL